MHCAADQQTIRHTNEKLIISYVRDHENVTRATLSQALSLSPPSVSNNVDHLIQKNLLRCIGTEQSGAEKLGRKGVLLDINGAFSYVLCVDLSSQSICVGIADLKEQPVCDPVRVFCISNLAQAVCETIYQAVDTTIRDAGLTWEAIGVIVVGAPGVINESTGTMAYAAQFEGWEQINLKQLLQARYNVPVLVKNDINTLSLGEVKYGHGKHYSDFVVICLDLGVGAGIILNGKLFTGANFAAGEVGYMVLEKDKLARQGNLEQQISISAIKKQIGEALGIKEESVTTQFINAHYGTDDRVKKIITEAVQLLGMLIINIVAVLNVPLVCLTGFVTEFNMDIVGQLRKIVQDSVPHTPQIEISVLGQYALLRGGFLVGVDWILKNTIERG